MAIPFSSDKFPPAPVLTLQLSIPQEAPHPELLSALIDTDSDFTLVPLRWLILIDAPESRSALIRGLWSSLQEVTVYWVDIYLDQGILPGVEVVGVPGDENTFFRTRLDFSPFSGPGS